MLRQFLQFIEKEKLFSPDERVLLALSGGIDSMVMQHLFEKAGFNYAVAHCNFKLRAKESDGDEMFLTEIFLHKNIPFYSTSFQTEKYSKEHSISIQMAARELRYSWLQEIRTVSSCQYIASAHHLDDNIETFFINLFRGTGISGLRGIQPKTGYIIRPLLFCSRHEIELYARLNNIIYRNDSSNDQDHYLRNKIRHRLVPVIHDLQPGIHKIMFSNFNILKEQENIFLDKINEIKNELITGKNQTILVDLNKLFQYSTPKTILLHILSPYGFNESMTDDIISSPVNSSGKKYLSESHEIILNRGTLIIRKREPDSGPDQYFIKIPDHPASWLIEEPVRLRFTITFPDKIKIRPEAEFAFIDPGLLGNQQEIVIRKWRKGDYFFPFGMKGKKLLSNFFIDEKYSLAEKNEAWLLCSGDKIIWIIGKRPDNRFRITAETKTVLVAELISG